MPPRKEVQSLYFQCLDCIFENIYETLNSGISQAELERMRRYYTTHLHGGIRELILKLAILKDMNRIQILLQMINLLIDSNIHYLCTISNPGFILPEHYSTLMSHLSRRDCVGLKSLYIRVLYNRPETNEKDPVLKTNKLMFHSLLSRGLARNLTVLVLGRCCDNEVLRILGQNCVHLTKLDVGSSWAVTDDGFKYLCVKNPNKAQNTSETSYTPQLILELMNMKDSRLNRCCFSLCDVRIQETNTTNATVLMLLIFIKNLKTLGGFIYFRSVGDNIVYLSRLARGSLKLNFTELYDTHLTDAKLEQLALVIPDLTAVYTRSIYVQPLLSRFHKLNDITIDFDYQPYEDYFYRFLTSSGGQLKRISLIDKNGFLDINRIFKMCPNLIEINGSVTTDDLIKVFLVPKLKKANLKIVKFSTVLWLLLNAPNLEYLQVQAFSYDIEYIEDTLVFNNRFLENILRLRPSCFDTLKYFLIHVSYEVENEDDCFPFTKATILKLINECKELTLIGDLATWFVSEHDVEHIRNTLKSKNLDVTIVYKNECKPDITMQSIRDFSSV